MKFFIVKSQSPQQLLDGLTTKQHSYYLTAPEQNETKFSAGVKISSLQQV